jgi:hypothetical protein
VALEIIQGVIEGTSQLMFLEGSVGTAKTFTIRALIAYLESIGKKCLICATTGIAVVQYPGGTRLHSLFRLGIDEESSRRSRPNIGRGTFHAEYILVGDLIVIDEVWTLTLWVANRVSMTFQSISPQEEMDFRGRTILFVGDPLPITSSGSKVRNAHCGLFDHTAFNSMNWRHPRPSCVSKSSAIQH